MTRVTLLGCLFALGCAHQPPAPSNTGALNADEEFEVAVAAYKEIGVGRTDGVIWCVYGSFEGAKGADASSRLLRALEPTSSVVWPASECRNWGIQPPFLLEGTSARFRFADVVRLNASHADSVSVVTTFGCFPGLDACITRVAAKYEIARANGTWTVMSMDIISVDGESHWHL